MPEKELPRVPAYPHHAYGGFSPRDGPWRDEKDPEAYKMSCPKDWYPQTAPFDRKPTMRTMTSLSLTSDPTRPLAGGRDDDDRLLGKRERIRVCGLRRRSFYVLLAFSLLLVVGLVVGLTVVFTVVKDPPEMSTDGDSAPVPIPTPPSVAPKAPELPGDPMPGTSLATVTYAQQAVIAANLQSLHLYYQDVEGNIYEVQHDSALPGWKNATAIFPDARKHSGLAAFTYSDGTEQVNFVLYVDKDNILQGKRKLLDNPNWETWESLQNGAFPVNGTDARVEDDRADVSLDEDEYDPSLDDKGSLRLAAVYSSDFAGGPGARVFYHAKPAQAEGEEGEEEEEEGESGWVQELVWDQRSDSWSEGAKITNVVSTSQLAATIDGQYLRLFYSTGNNTLQESWLDIKSSNGTYTPGISKSDVFTRDDAAISALSVSGSTLVYCLSQRTGIRELNITGTPGSDDERVEVNPSTVATADTQPLMSLGSVVGSTPEGGPQVYVFRSAWLGADAVWERIPSIVERTRDLAEETWPLSLELERLARLPLGRVSSKQ